MSSSEGFGIMEGAYFVGRMQLLSWLNDFFGFKYDKVEQCANGAAYCQILDAIYPGKVPLHRVKFSAKLEHEFIHNFKILQSAFDAVHLKRRIHVELLTKGKYMDNLEFLQWFKRFFEVHYNVDSNYNARERRREALQVFNSARHIRNRQSSANSTSSAVSATPCVTKTRTASRKSRCSVATVSRNTNTNAINIEQKENQRLKREIVRIKNTASELEKERDYYFDKLHQMDQLFHSEIDSAEEFINRIQSILYDNVEPRNEEPSSPGPIPLPEKISPNIHDKENIGDVSTSPLF